ncbi:hypothetical protein Tco_0362895 [Tanacetum coccineum]
MPFCGCDCAYTMADVNVNDPRQKQLLFGSFTASSTIPSIYIQQFWDTVRYDKTTRSYSCQLDKQWLDLTKDTLREALQITPVDNNNAFSSPPTPDVLIKFVNDLGYPKVVRTLSDVVTNDIFQPWRALTTIINLCLTGKTSGFERPRALVLQIIWGERKKVNLIVILSVRFTKLIIHHLQRKHKFHPRLGSPLHLPNEESILGYLKFTAKGTKREVFGMPIPNNLITADIQGEQYYNAYLEKVAKHQRYLASEEVSNPDSPAPKPAKATEPKATKQSKPLAPKATPVTKPAAAKALKPTTSQPPKKDQSKKHKLVKESSEAPSPSKRPKAGSGRKFKGCHAAHQGPLPPVVIREPESGKFQPLSKVQGKGKEKVGEEQAAQVLLNLQTPMKKSPADQFIFQRRTPAPTEPSGLEESSSLYAKLGLTDSETEYDDDVSPEINPEAQDEGQARPNPGKQVEVQDALNPSDAADSQPQPSHVVHVGPNLKHMDFEATNASTQQNPEQMDEGFIATAYPKVQENLKLMVEEQVILKEPASSTGTLSSLQHLAKDFNFGNQFFNDKPSDAKNEKTNVETEAESMVSVTIHQDTSAIPPMTSSVIDLISRPDSPNEHRPLPATVTATATTTTTITTLPLPTTTKHHRFHLDKAHRLYKLENLDIPHQVSKAVDEIVMDAVDWAIQTPLRDRFRDLPEADIKEILHHRMWETNSYKAHEDHKKLYEALEMSMDRDHSDQLLTDLAEARRKKKKRHDL